MKTKYFRIGLITLILLGIMGSAYLLTKRLASDRAAAMSYQGRPAPTSIAPTSTRTTKTYTAKDLEEARQSGQVSPDKSSSAAAGNPAHDAVQRNLRTLEEINRINQMNQRLMEQQERMRRQQNRN